MGVAGDTRLSRGFTPESPTVTLRCRNCQAELTGPFCARCGQRDLPPNPTFRELFEEAWDAFVSVDGRFIQSLRLLVRRPGELTVRYLEGKRAAYIPPLRLYLMCSVAFFVMQAVAPESGTFRIAMTKTGSRAGRVSVTPFDSAVTRGSATAARMQRGMRKAVSDQKSFGQQVREKMPNALFLLVPLYAFLLRVAYRARRRNFPAHLVFALHSHAFLFAIMAAVTALGWALPRRAGEGVEGLALFALAAYFPIALRRVYGGNWPGTIARATLTFVPYMLATGAVMIGLIMLTFYMAGAQP